MKKTLFIFLGAVLGMLTTNCSVVPETGRNQFNYISEKRESKLGKRAWRRYEKKRTIASDPKYNSSLNRVVGRMLRVVNAPNAKWEFVVFLDDKPNAVVLPNGKMGINTGLFHLAETEGCLAAAIGHEMGHVKARHVAERLSNKKAGSTAAFLAGLALQQSTGIPAGAVNAGVYIANSGRMIVLTKRQELEADQLGVLLMAEAGYDPREALTFWIKMKGYIEAHPDQFKSGIFASHPPIEKRIEAVQEIMPQALVVYHEVVK